MTRRRWTPGRALSASLIACAGVAGCQPAASSPASVKKPPAPAKFNPIKETDLATVVLTPEAEASLALATAPVERKAVPRTVNYAGEVIIPTGRLVIVNSPFTGMLEAPSDAGVMMPGTAIKQGQPIFVLIPILTPEARAQMAPQLIQAEGQVKQATEQLKIAKITLDRAEELLRQRLGGKAAVDDARAAYDLAQANLKAAESTREILTKVGADVETGSINRQTIKAPASGILQNLHARPGQEVAAGAALFEVASLDPIWIKVPVYVGDLERIAAAREAGVGGLAGVPGAEVRRARPVTAPPSGDPLAATVNLFYEVENKDGALRPNQRVGVTLPLKGEDEGLVVPRAALLRDIHGGAWVYEETGPHTFTRRRVVVDRVVGDLAALAGGALKPGAKVVTAGAAEVFGAEFGGTK
jgi:membrane fusion protein, heavy metal efflux system